MAFSQASNLFTALFLYSVIDAKSNSGNKNQYATLSNQPSSRKFLSIRDSENPPDRNAKNRRVIARQSIFFIAQIKQDLCLFMSGSKIAGLMFIDCKDPSYSRTSSSCLLSATISFFSKAIRKLLFQKRQRHEPRFPTQLPMPLP